MAAAPTSLKFIGPKQIVSALDSNKVLDIEGASYKEGAKLHIWQNFKTLNQKFLLKKLDLQNL